MSWTTTGTPGIRSRLGIDGKKQYMARWRDHGGQQVACTFATKKAAIAAREQARAEVRRIRAGQLAPPPDAGRTFDDLAAHWLEVKAGKRSIRDDCSRISKHLLPTFGGLELVAINKAVVDGFYLKLLGVCRSGAMSPKTARNILTLLSSMLNEAWKQDWIARVPYVEKPKLDEQTFSWITNDQVLQLLEAAAADRAHPQLEPILALGAYTGLRAGEVLGLQWTDVSFARRLITAQRSYGRPYTKTGAVKRVPLLDVLEGHLRRWKADSPAGSWLFPSGTGEARHKSDVHLQEHFQKAVAAAGLTRDVIQGSGKKRLTFHDLRHSFASNWMAAGGDIFKLQRILGHSSVTTTMRYAHLAPRAFEGDYGRFGGGA